MRQFSSRWVVFGLTAMLLAGSIGLVDAQIRKKGQANRKMKVPQSTSKNLGVATFNPAAIAIDTKSKIAFRPKLLTSNGTASGSPVDPNLRVDIQGGKRARSEDLVNGTNELERNLNDLGYSLYTDENDTQKPVVKIRSVTLNLNAQANDLRALGGMKGSTPVPATRDVSSELASFGTRPPTIKNTVPGATIVPGSTTSTSKGGKSGSGNSSNTGSLRRGNQRMTGSLNPTMGTATIKQPPPTFVTIDKEVPLFAKTYGDPNWFAIEFDSNLTKKATMKVRKVTAKADVKATIMGKKITLFHAKAEAGGKKDFNTETMPIRTGPRGPGRRNSGGGNASPSSTAESIRVLEATCLGDDLISPVDLTTSGKSRQKIDNKSVNWEYSVKIPIIPAVNAVGTLGARGSLGLTLVADADTEDGEIKIKPKVDTAVYAQIGIEVNLLVASVEGGLEAELTLLDYELDISAGVGITRTNINDVTYIAAATPITVTHSFESLSGRLFGYAKVGYWLPFRTREKTLWRDDLIDWNGFTDSRTLYSENSDAVILGQSNIPMKTAKVSLGGG